MKTLIIGGGAVGSTLAGYLARAGRDVTIADGWFQHVEAVRENGLRVQAVEGDFVTDVRAIHLDELVDYGTADLLLVAGKAFDTRMQALLAREHLHDGTVVMSSQNGMNDAVIGDIVGHDRMVACVVALAADLFEAGAVRRTSDATTGSIVIGHLEQGRDAVVTQRLLEHFEPLGGVRVVDDAWPERWGKLTLNSMSNALAGLTGLWSDRLWSEPMTLDVIIALGHETASVAAAAGIKTAPVLGRIPQDLLVAADSKSGAAWQEAAGIMLGISAERVGKKANRASLLQDVMKGRRTEVDYLNGWIVRKGAELGVPTPVHSMLIEALYPVQVGKIPYEMENARPIAERLGEWYA
ncbi:MAG: 2-dehydropantoate 2-reductase [Naasia sp.]|nr:2-dehydropantoate 2-reductase [Naasia sp.]